MSQIEVPKGWNERTLGSLTIESRNGKTGRPKDQPPGIPRLGITSVTKSISGFIDESESKFLDMVDSEIGSYVVVNDDILVCRQNGKKDFVGKFAIYRGNTKPLIFSDSLIKFKIDTKEILPEFLVYFTKSSLGRIQIDQYCMTTAGNYSINAPNLKQIVIPLPSIEVQKKIVQKLDYILGLLEAKKKSILELNQRKIKEITNLKSNLSINLMQKYFQIDNNIPNGWKIKKLFEISKIGQGGTPSRARSEYWNGDIPWLRSGELLNNVITHSNEKITTLGLKNSSTQLCPKGTILMAMTGQGLTRGRTALLGIDACANQSCAHIIVNDNIVSEFLWLFLQSRYWFIRSIHHGSGQPGINTGLIKQLEIPVPPTTKEQLKIVEKIRKNLSHTEVIKSKLENILESEKLLEKYLDSIHSKVLDNAFSGKLAN